VPDPTGSVLALDIGGTKIAAALVAPDGTLSGRASVATPKDGDAKELLGAAPRLCGVGCGGPMDAETVSPLNIPAWRRFPLSQMLGDELGLDVVVDNDAKALALAEGWLGSARDSQNFLAMVVSTGVGGGIVLGGRLLGGRLGNAGHIGHVIVEPDGRRCSCGAQGCLEAEASGSAIEDVSGEPAALAPLEVRVRSGMLVGRAIASVASLLDLDLAVVGGSVALGYGEPFFDAAQVELSARARLDFSRTCRVVPVGLGDRAPLVGAGAIALRHGGATWIPR
jgi:glucokinase